MKKIYGGEMNHPPCNSNDAPGGEGGGGGGGGGCVTCSTQSTYTGCSCGDTQTQTVIGDPCGNVECAGNALVHPCNCTGNANVCEAACVSVNMIWGFGCAEMIPQTEL